MGTFALRDLQQAADALRELGKPIDVGTLAEALEQDKDEEQH